MARRWARGPLLLACAFRCGVSGPGDARSRTPPRTAAAMPSYCRGAGHVPGSGAVCHSPQRTPLAHPSSCSFSIVCCRNGFRSGGVRAGLQPTPIGGGPRRDLGSRNGAVSYVDTATRADWARLRRRVLLAVSLVVTASC